MFRIKNNLFNITNILRRQRVEIQVLKICQYPRTQYKVQVREPCPPKPPPPPPKPKDDTAFWGALTVIFIAGAFAVIAKRSPEIRDWLIIYAPWFDDFIAIAYEENMTYGEFARQCVEDVKNFFYKTLTDDNKPKPCSMDDSQKPVIRKFLLGITEVIFILLLFLGVLLRVVVKIVRLNRHIGAIPLLSKTSDVYELPYYKKKKGIL